MQNLNLKKTFLYTLIGSVAISALMGIWVILAKEFNEFQGRVLATALTVVITSILGLACGAFWESPKTQNSSLTIIPILGMVLAFVSALISLALIWQIVSSTENRILKAFAVGSIFAFSFSQLSLLSLANLSKKFQWALTAVYWVVLGLASLSSAIIVLDTESPNDFVTRLLGVLAVIDAALTVMIPIFHRLSLGDFVVLQPEVEKIETEIERLKAQIEKLEKQKAEILQSESNSPTSEN